LAFASGVFESRQKPAFPLLPEEDDVLSEQFGVEPPSEISGSASWPTSFVGEASRNAASEAASSKCATPLTRLS
jgi:hypothetical protein